MVQYSRFILYLNYIYKSAFLIVGHIINFILLPLSGFFLYHVVVQKQWVIVFFVIFSTSTFSTERMISCCYLIGQMSAPSACLFSWLFKMTLPLFWRGPNGHVNLYIYIYFFTVWLPPSCHSSLNHRNMQECCQAPLIYNQHWVFSYRFLFLILFRFSQSLHLHLYMPAALAFMAGITSIVYYHNIETSNFPKLLLGTFFSYLCSPVSFFSKYNLLKLCNTW